MTIEQIKQRIQELRQMRHADEIDLIAEQKAEQAFRDELYPLGLTCFWVSEHQDYAIFNNEGIAQ